MNFEIEKFRNLGRRGEEYSKQLSRLKGLGYETEHIEDTVDAASKNLQQETPDPFIIYGEPQSGKTEMMLCLTARLIDDGFKLIIVLLNDSVDLLGQNLGRFRGSNLSPTPRNFTEILDAMHDLRSSTQVLFCKKNAKDLEKLIDRIDGLGQVVVIDDEADYASPNAQINKNDQSKINQLIEKLKGVNGLYVGVTATPARLDLNNTFGNKSASWVEFKTHSKYTGQDDFFPLKESVKFSLCLLPDQGDKSEYPINAFFRYLAACAYLNVDAAPKKEKNYSMLIHTSVRTDDHAKDMKLIQETIQALSDASNSKFDKHVKQLWGQIRERYPNVNTDKLTKYILRNIQRNQLIVLNSKRDVTVSGADASNPQSLFTVVFGGNIVSRGVTLNNLLSMYFTRNVKHKIQQDTYIQRARMFGTRGDYLEHFELSIPKSLYRDWHKCFFYHKLSLNAARDNNAPVWHTDQRVSAVASSSIDQSSVVQYGAKEISFGVFDFSPNKINEFAPIRDNPKGRKLTLKEIQELAELLGEGVLPNHLVQFIEHSDGGRWKNECAFYPVESIQNMTEDPDRGDNFSQIIRSRGFWGQFNRDLEKKFSHLKGAVHNFRVFYNGDGRARLFYRYNLKNLRYLQRSNVT